MSDIMRVVPDDHGKARIIEIFPNFWTEELAQMLASAEHNRHHVFMFVELRPSEET